MSDNELGESLRKFIAENIESVERLEILLLLSRSPNKTWSIPEVYQKIQSSISSVTQKLGELAAAGFFRREVNDSFRYAPASEKVHQQVIALDEAYRTRRIKVIESIFSKGNDQIQKFADAFKIRKDNK